MKKYSFLAAVLLSLLRPSPASLAGDASKSDAAFFERRIRPVFVQHCYQCHSEQANEKQGGLLLDRQSGWLGGGDSAKAVIPGEPDSSLLIAAVRYENEDLQMPPDDRLDRETIKLLEQWIRRGAPGPAEDIGHTEFSRLGDQAYLFGQAQAHWAFQPITATEPPKVSDSRWNNSPIDRFVYEALRQHKLTPSDQADPRTLIRRLHFDLIGLPPTMADVNHFLDAYERDREDAVFNAIDALIQSPGFGERLARLWLDVARYADTDSFYRPDTRTPHYFPFAFTYRDYVVDSFNSDKLLNQFIMEQYAADLMGFDADSPEIAALGFLTVGPHANRNPTEAVDDWIDVTTRGLMGLTVACARCHDHKFEPVPTADYYSLHGVFASLVRVDPLDEKNLPLVSGYQATNQELADYEKKRAAIDKKINGAAGKKASSNNRSISQKIRETELAELLLFHPGAPARAMIVKDRPKPVDAFIYLRGDASARGDRVPRRFLKVLDEQQTPFPENASGRLQLAERIVDPDNPLTARVFVNRIWGYLIGSHLVDTPSDFGLQGAAPTHPQLLDWLAADFIAHDWSVKHLVQQIVASQTYRQSGDHRESAARIDPLNQQLWRANRKHLSIEAIRDSLLAVSGQLDRTPRGRAAELWGTDYTRRRAIYGYINRFNLDPTLRAFDFPTPMQTQPQRGESIVAPQALFTMNAPFVIDQARALAESNALANCETDRQRIEVLFQAVFQRLPADVEVTRIEKFMEFQERFKTAPDRPTRFTHSPWQLVAQSLMMSNEFQYID